MIETMLRWSLRTSRDLVVLRKRIEQASEIVGAGALTRTRWATAASDVARAVLDAGGGEAVIGLGSGETLILDLVTSGLIDPGLADGARRLVADCRLTSDLSGTEVRLRLVPPAGRILPEVIGRLRSELASAQVGDDVTALYSENRRLQTAMAALEVAKAGRERLLSVHRTVLAVLPDVVWRSDDNGRLRFVNPRWTSMTGRSAARPGMLFDAIIELDRPRVREEWRAAVEAGSPIRVECRLIGARGRERWVLMHGRPHQQGGERREWIGAITDIHDTKLREIEQARLIEFRDRMVGVVGHDLRSPLWFIGTAARMLLDHGEDAERRARYLTQIVENVDRSRRMIDALLDYTRTQLGAELIGEREPVDARGILEELAAQSRVTHPEREVVVQGPQSLSVEVDADRLVQALGNLLANALSYGRPDAPLILDADGDGRRVRLTVRNRAEPIPPERLAHIFEPFRRAHDGGNNSRGLGLGLYIVRAIARAHGGEARLTSAPDGWIEACIELPRRSGGEGQTVAPKVE